MPGLAISLASMADAEEAHGVIVNGEQDAVIANAEAKPSAEVALERDDIPGAGARKAENALEDAHGRRLVRRANVSLGFTEPFNSVSRHYLVFLVETGKSPGLRPNSARTSSIGMPLPPRWANQA